MPYLYTNSHNFEDYASGRVFYAQAGQPAFPVRLASEIFQRALRHWRTAGGEGRIHIYDPVCGGAYWLTVLAYLHWNEIAAISASDVVGDVLFLAKRNLSLLTLAGLNQRIAEIERMFSEFGKESHAAALESAWRFHQQLTLNLATHTIEAQVFQVDATDPESLRCGMGPQQADLVLADVPYGWHSTWISDGKGDQTTVESMLVALHPTLRPGSVVAIAADKAQKVHPKNYRRLERFQIGKRRIFIFEPQ
jgi:hypothetical protein